MKSIIVAAALLAAAAPAFANQSASAKAMAETIQAAGSGKEPARSIKGGWGNAVGPAKGTNGGTVVGPKPGK